MHTLVNRQSGSCTQEPQPQSAQLIAQSCEHVHDSSRDGQDMPVVAALVWLTRADQPGHMLGERA